MDKRKINASGCYDLTAFKAIEKASREEKEERERLKHLLKTIFRDCERYGYHLEGRIVLKDKKTGKIWR